MKPKKIKLEKISIDGGTQTRVAINEVVVDEYLVDMDAGSEFPPVEVYQDGATYWLVDGFHRYHAAIKLGRDSITAFVHKGVKGDAVWASLAANKTHGLRRTNDDKANAVKRALESKPALSDRAIAEHVGVGNKMVGDYCRQRLTVLKTQSTKRTGRDGRTTNTANIGKTKPQAPKTTRSGKDAGGSDDSSDVSAPDGRFVASDQLGKPITDDRLAGIFQRRCEIVDLMREISAIKSRVIKGIESKDSLFSGISQSRFVADCANVYRALKFAAPYAACPYCGGSNRGCKACGGRGWVGEEVYKAAPGELKK